MEKERELEEIRESDLINSVAYYKAKKTGLIEDIGLPDTAFGTLGAMASDIQENMINYARGEITKNELEENIDRTVVTGFTAIVVKAYEVVVEKPVLSSIKSKLPPVLSNVVDSAAKFVKEKIIQKGAELIEKAWNGVKSFFKKLFA
jgi:hypothetical protein